MPSEKPSEKIRRLAIKGNFDELVAFVEESLNNEYWEGYHDGYEYGLRDRDDEKYCLDREFEDEYYRDADYE